MGPAQNVTETVIIELPAVQNFVSEITQNVLANSSVLNKIHIFLAIDAKPLGKTASFESVMPQVSNNVPIDVAGQLSRIEILVAAQRATILSIANELGLRE